MADLLNRKLVIIKPLITEKNTDLQEAKNQYVFEVAMDANKIEIKKEIEKRFNVHVKNVKTLVRKGKSKTQFTKKGRFSGYSPDMKKAIVTLKKDDKIDLFGTAE
jgi:large subunit ribosomal protein L23